MGAYRGFMNNLDVINLVKGVTTGVRLCMPSPAYEDLKRFSQQFSYNLDSIKEDFLKVSETTDTMNKIKALDQQGLALVLAHNAYTVGAALTGCMYTNPEDYDPVHTLACITDALACILVLKELKGVTE